MARLKIFLRGAMISDFSLETSKEYLGGRKENCEIKLQPEKGISREHFKIRFQEGKWVLSSLSRFGEIYSVGQKVETLTFDHGVSFQVPPYEFQFRDLPEEDSALNDQSKNSIAIGESDKTVVGINQQAPFIKMVSANGEIREMLRLEGGDVWVSGRDPACQIMIPDQRVSRKQFEVRKINGVFTIIDLNSVNGTFLNGSPISSVDPQTLKSGDSISVLDNIMYFELHDPNFKNRIGKIDIPQINIIGNSELNLGPEEFSQLSEPSLVSSQVNSSVSSQSQISDQSKVNQLMESEIAQRPGKKAPLILQQVDEPYVDQQQRSGAQQRTQQNQNYYQFENTANETQEPIAESPISKLRKSKPVMLALVLVILGGAYYINDMMEVANRKKAVKKEVITSDPFSKLTAEQKKTVQDFYNFSQKSMLQNKYSFAIENLKKLHEILPSGFKDSKSMEEEATLNEQIISQKLEQERQDKIKAEQDAEILATVAKCQKILGPKVTVDLMRNCLSPIALIDPSNNEYTRLMTEAEKIAMDIEAEKTRKNLAQPPVIDELGELFTKAERIRNQGYPKKAIQAYLVVINSELKDEKNHKKMAQKRIDFVRERVQEKIDKIIAEAESIFKEGKLKAGIGILAKGLDIDFENKILKERIQNHTSELRNQVKLIYQESVIDENFGNIEGDDARSGAKQKWKKILDLDIEDGEYYRKAFTKLKRYGAF